jgi:hypothetical protein
MKQEVHLMVRLRALLVGAALVAGACSSSGTPGPAAAVSSPGASAPPLVATAAPTSAPTAAIATSRATATPLALPPSPAPTPAPTPTAKPTPSPAPSETPTDLNGTWTGTWQNSTPDQASGTFELTWARKASTMTGSIVIRGTPCLTGGSVSGTLSGAAISFGAVSGQVHVSYDGTIAGSHMSGTYATSCGKARGTWEATHK